jgi:protein-disulfide isomerase
MQIRFNEETESAGEVREVGSSSESADLERALDDNKAAMIEIGISGTPGIFYRDANDKVRHRYGMPRLSELPGIAQMAEQAQSDARLAPWSDVRLPRR